MHVDLERCSASSSARVYECISPWKRLSGERASSDAHLPFPNLRWNKFPHLPPGKPTVLFLDVSRFHRNSRTEGRTTLHHYRDYAGLKFRFRSSETNYVNLRQYAIRSCLRFPANKFTSESSVSDPQSIENRECYILRLYIAIFIKRLEFEVSVAESNRSVLQQRDVCET